MELYKVRTYEFRRLTTLPRFTDDADLRVLHHECAAMLALCCSPD